MAPQKDGRGKIDHLKHHAHNMQGSEKLQQARSGKDGLNISIHGHQDEYYLGDTIEGVLEMHLESAASIGDISLIFHGVSRAYRGSYDDDDYVVETSMIEIFKFEERVHAATDEIQKPGVLTFPFNFTIPSVCDMKETGPITTLPDYRSGRGVFATSLRGQPPASTKGWGGLRLGTIRNSWIRYSICAEGTFCRASWYSSTIRSRATTANLPVIIGNRPTPLQSEVQTFSLKQWQPFLADSGSKLSGAAMPAIVNVDVTMLASYSINPTASRPFLFTLTFSQSYPALNFPGLEFTVQGIELKLKAVHHVNAGTSYEKHKPREFQIRSIVQSIDQKVSMPPTVNEGIAHRSPCTASAKYVIFPTGRSIHRAASSEEHAGHRELRGDFSEVVRCGPTFSTVNLARTWEVDWEIEVLISGQKKSCRLSSNRFGDTVSKEIHLTP